MQTISSTIIFSDKYADLHFDSSSSMLLEIWKTSTEKMTDEEFKVYQFKKIQHVKNTNPSLFLCNTQDFLYTLMPDMQEWVDQELNKVWNEVKLTKFAMVMSKGYVEQLSLEQTMTDEDFEINFTFKFFDNEEDAKKWLVDKRY